MLKITMGFIYKIIGGDECYIGSTFKTLETRFKKHIQHYQSDNYCSSQYLFNKYGVENCHIEPIEELNCDKKLYECTCSAKPLTLKP